MDNSSKGLNENPQMPDTSRIQKNLTSGSLKVPVVNITNIIIKTEAQNAAMSLEAQLEKAIKDTTLGL